MTKTIITEKTTFNRYNHSTKCRTSRKYWSYYKKISLENIYDWAQSITITKNTNAVNIEIVPTKEIQTEDNIPVAFEDVNIAHWKLCDRIYRLVEVQMCHACEESYSRI